MPTFRSPFSRLDTASSAAPRSLLVLALACAIYLAYAWYLFGFLPDDTYIFLRYARNWAHGLGPVYNEGERLQGYTSFLWLACLTLAERLHLPAVETAKVSSSVLGLGVVFVCWLLGREVARDGARTRVTLAPLLLLSFVDLPYWSVSGMETALFTLLANTSLLLYLLSWRRDSMLMWAALCTAVTALARPEGLLLAAFLGGCELRRTRGQLARRHWIAALCCALPVAAAVAASVWYYGDIVPNTYYAKRQVLSSALWNGTRYIRTFLSDSGGASIPLLAAVAFVDPARRRGVLVLGSWTALVGLYLIWIGGDSFAWLGTHRFMVPLLPAIAVLLDAGLRALDGWVLGAAPSSRARLFWRAAQVVIVVSMLNPTGLTARYRGRLGGDEELARLLAAAGRPGDWLLVGDIGTFGYYAPLRILDAFGLTDRYIGRQLVKDGYAHFGPSDAQKFVEYVLQRNPRFVILKGTQQDSRLAVTSENADAALHADPRFAERYLFVRQARRSPHLLFVSRADPIE